MIYLTSVEFRFVSKCVYDGYWVDNTEVICEEDFTDWTNTKKIEDGYGMIHGPTFDTYPGYKGELPRYKSDSSSFSEFDIYYKDVLLNKMTYNELILLIKSDDREDKINSIIG